MSDGKPRVFVVRETVKKSIDGRPLLHAFTEDMLRSVTSQCGSQNCYLSINDIETNHSFDDFVKLLGERVDL